MRQVVKLSGPSGRDNKPLRVADHRFEWDRSEFREWAGTLAMRFGYAVRYGSDGTPISAFTGNQAVSLVACLWKGGVLALCELTQQPVRINAVHGAQCITLQ